MRPALLVLLAVAILPFALAGSPEAPELADPEGDCEFAAGNEYLDIVSSWVSDETADAFNVNLALAKWTDGAGEAAAYTVQFKHQTRQFGVTALYDAASGGWIYGNAVVDDQGVSNYTDATGSFTPGPPAKITVLFNKANFPHSPSSQDNRLVEFTALSADFKALYPTWFVPAELPAYPPGVMCDEGKGDGVYLFAVGEHAAHEAGPLDSPETNATLTAGANDAARGADDASAIQGEAKASPGLGAAAALAVAGVAAWAARRGR